MKQCMDIRLVVEDAVNNGLNGQSCSEALASAFGQWLGRDAGLLRGMASGFAGGMGLRGETCGVVAAGMLVIGAEFGPQMADDNRKKAWILSLASEFAEAFAKENGSTLCGELCQGADFRSPEGAKALRDSGKPERLIRNGAALLAGLVLREKAGKSVSGDGVA